MPTHAALLLARAARRAVERARAALRRAGAAASDLRASEAEQRYRSLFDHNPDPVYSFDREGRYTSMNPAGQALVGDDVLGRTFADVVHPDDLERVRGHFLQALAGAPQSYECRAVAVDGRVLALRVTNSAIVVDGEVVGAFGVAKDITERVDAERRLQVSRQRYKALYDRNPDAVYSQDLQGRFLSGNRACTVITGYGPGELAGATLDHLLEPGDRPGARAGFSARWPARAATTPAPSCAATGSARTCAS